MLITASKHWIASASVAVIVALAPAPPVYSRGEELIGKEPPAFEATSLNQGLQSLQSYKGKVVLLDFWAVWCGPCLVEMPRIKKLYDRFRGKDFVLLGISLDTDQGKLNSYLQKNGIDWPIFFDGKGWNNRIAVLYGVRAIPFTVLIDRSGVVRKVGLRGTELENAVAAMVQ